MKNINANEFEIKGVLLKKGWGLLGTGNHDRFFIKYINIDEIDYYEPIVIDHNPGLPDHY